MSKPFGSPSVSAKTNADFRLYLGKRTDIIHIPPAAQFYLHIPELLRISGYRAIFTHFFRNVYIDIKTIFYLVIIMADLPKAALIRLAKAAGVERIGDEAADALVAATEAYVAKIAKKANGIAANAGRKTLKADDIKLAVD